MWCIWSQATKLPRVWSSQAVREITKTTKTVFSTSMPTNMLTADD